MKAGKYANRVTVRYHGKEIRIVHNDEMRFVVTSYRSIMDGNILPIMLGWIEICSSEAEATWSPGQLVYSFENHYCRQTEQFSKFLYYSILVNYSIVSEDNAVNVKNRDPMSP